MIHLAFFLLTHLHGRDIIVYTDGVIGKANHEGIQEDRRLRACQHAEQAADERTSLAMQEQHIRGLGMLYSAKVEMFVDSAVSGSVPLAQRPVGKRLVEALEPGTLVIAAKLDRLFRSAADALTTAKSWHKRGVDLVLIDCGTDPVSANGVSKLFFSILASVAEFERQRIRERMIEGRAGKRARGGHVGGDAPYGYRKEGAGRVAALVEDPAEQELVETIRKRHNRGMSLRRIAALMTKEGKTTRAGTPFSAGQLHRILKAGG